MPTQDYYLFFNALSIMSIPFRSDELEASAGPVKRDKNFGKSREA